MAKVLNYGSEIANGLPIQPEHIQQTVDALTGADDYDITISGSLNITGSIAASQYTISHPNSTYYLSGSTSYLNHLRVNSIIGSNNFSNGVQGWQIENGGQSSNTLRFDSNVFNFYGGGGIGQIMVIKEDGSVGIGITLPTSKLQVVGLLEFSNNTTALAGGLSVGAFYHTAGVLKVVI